jgi:DNA-binding response OmpR family regulator
MLTEMDLAVVEASNVEEARTLLARRRFDLLITDLSLPDGSGFDVAREALARHGKVEVVFASGRHAPPPQDLSDATWLPKPYDFQSLAAAIGAASRVATD